MNNVDEREYVLEQSLERIREVNEEIANLTVEKEKLTDEIIAALGHEKAGQQSYAHGKYKITCKTPNIYSLDKAAYMNGDVYLEDNFNPIRETKAYTVDKALFEHYYATSPESVRESLVRLVTVKPGKPSVSVGVR